MNLDPNDPLLTAYVLGELEPAKRDAVERMLHESPECRQAVDEIRLTIAWLSRELRQEVETEPMTASVNQQPVVQASGQPTSKATPWLRRNGYKLMGLAALVLVGATVAFVSIGPSVRDGVRPAAIVVMAPQPVAAKGAAADRTADERITFVEATKLPAAAPAQPVSLKNKDQYSQPEALDREAELKVDSSIPRVASAAASAAPAPAPAASGEPAGTRGTRHAQSSPKRRGPRRGRA